MDIFRGNTIYLRLLEPQDYETTYLWRNDYNIQKMTCGPLRYISKEMEKTWAQNRSLDNYRNIYVAICSIKSDKIIGYMSLNDIDYVNRSCVGGGIVIGDNEYRDGTAYLEAELMVIDYAFNQLNMNRYSGECLEQHVLSRANLLALNFKNEGRKRQAVYKNGQYHDVLFFSLLRDDYYYYLDAGNYEIDKIISNTVYYVKEIRKEFKKTKK